MTDKPRPISFRPTAKDIEHIAGIRERVEWIASDADAIRYALDRALEWLKAWHE